MPREVRREAREVLRHAIELDPTMLEAWIKLGEACEALQVRACQGTGAGVGAGIVQAEEEQERNGRGGWGKKEETSCCCC